MISSCYFVIYLDKQLGPALFWPDSVTKQKCAGQEFNDHEEDVV